MSNCSLVLSIHFKLKFASAITASNSRKILNKTKLHWNINTVEIRKSDHLWDWLKVVPFWNRSDLWNQPIMNGEILVSLFIDMSCYVLISRSIIKLMYWIWRHDIIKKHTIKKNIIHNYIYFCQNSVTESRSAVNNPMTPKVPYYDCQYCLILLLYKTQRNSLASIFLFDFEVTFIYLLYFKICWFQIVLNLFQRDIYLESCIDKYDTN